MDTTNQLLEIGRHCLEGVADYADFAAPFYTGPT